MRGVKGFVISREFLKYLNVSLNGIYVSRIKIKLCF